MYKIQSDNGSILGYVDTPAWVKKENNSPVPCVPVEATGVSYGGTVYNLLGHSDWPDNPTAFPSMVTDGEMLQIANAKNSQTVNGMESLLGHEQTRQEALELRRALQLLSTVLPEENALEVPSVYPVWTAGKKYKKDVILSYGENSVGDPQLYKTLKTHKAERTPDTDTDNYMPMGISSSGYPVWVQPLSNKDAYDKGDIVNRDGTLYQSNKNNNRDDPLDNTGRWDLYSDEPTPEPTPEPSPTYPEWVQPTDKSNAYNKGDIVSRNGTNYISTKNNNYDDPEAGTGTWEVYEEVVE